MEAKYNKIGIDYNLTRKADNLISERLYTLLNPDKNGIYLDIGCGTGNYTIELQKKGLNFIGIDPSTEMLVKAKKKNDNINWKIGTAEKTDLECESIDGIIAVLTIHHWSDLHKGFAELYRVLKNNGRMVIFTSTPTQMKGYWLNHYFPIMVNDSIVQMPSFEKVKSAMKSSGFETIGTEKYFVKPDLQDYFLYCGKERPELYLNEEVRKGISSFSALANYQEVEKGLIELRMDIDNEKINEVIESFHNKKVTIYLLPAKKTIVNRWYRHH
jgi:ubiquinone/menaquinone biosynthesis C-methylase UbiE